MHQVENKSKFLKQMLTILKQKYDLILSNPPYIEKFKFKYLSKDMLNMSQLRL